MNDRYPYGHLGRFSPPHTLAPKDIPQYLREMADKIEAGPEKASSLTADILDRLQCLETSPSWTP